VTLMTTVAVSNGADWWPSSSVADAVTLSVTVVLQLVVLPTNEHV
jgi:hypothetical protein